MPSEYDATDGVLAGGEVEWHDPGCTCDHRFGTQLEHDYLCPADDDQEDDR